MYSAVFPCWNVDESSFSFWDGCPLDLSSDIFPLLASLSVHVKQEKTHQPIQLGVEGLRRKKKAIITTPELKNTTTRSINHRGGVLVLYEFFFSPVGLVGTVLAMRGPDGERKGCRCDALSKPDEFWMSLSWPVARWCVLQGLIEMAFALIFLGLGIKLQISGLAGCL